MAWQVDLEAWLSTWPASASFHLSFKVIFSQVELVGHDGRIFNVNDKRLKHYNFQENGRFESILLDEPKWENGTTSG